jgi:hypothetical protein
MAPGESDVTSRLHPTALLLAVALAPACADSPMDRSFSENVGLAFESCNPAEIRFIASKHNFSPAFDWCGSNHFSQFSWSPDGRLLYFELTMAHHVMDASAENKATLTVPTPKPTGHAGWISSSRLAIPLGPDDTHEGYRIAIYDIDQSSLFDKPLPGLTDPSHVWPGDGPADVLFTALDAASVRQVYKLDLEGGGVQLAFPWIEGPVDTFTYARGVGVAVVGRKDTVTAYDELGVEVGTWTPATRGSLSPDGQWMMLEQLGDPVSIFSQRTWGELSDNARRRELQRTAAFEDKLPDSYPREVQPPTLSVVRMATGERWSFDAFYGDHFQWYEAQERFASFVLWGFEGKQFNRNVLLGNFFDRLRSIERGEQMIGLVPANAEAKRAVEAAAATGRPGAPEPEAEAKDEAADAPTAQLP